MDRNDYQILFETNALVKDIHSRLHALEEKMEDTQRMREAVKWLTWAVRTGYAGVVSWLSYIAFKQ